MCAGHPGGEEIPGRRDPDLLLAGLVVCGACDRRFDSHWAHNRPGYRCRHGRTSARGKTPPGRPAVPAARGQRRRRGCGRPSSRERVGDRLSWPGLDPRTA
ncbi:zinc ribbon domain-containing protein [Saccharopolyspora sp. NPDC049426]|uniref:zinc ribbon domain-containing protein n=1 Tax=Saccharopolyspora sp. NPDC049426 TaxID=3155652 RepID=UPI00342A4F77